MDTKTKLQRATKQLRTWQCPDCGSGPEVVRVVQSVVRKLCCDWSDPKAILKDCYEQWDNPFIKCDNCGWAIKSIFNEEYVPSPAEVASLLNWAKTAFGEGEGVR